MTNPFVELLRRAHQERWCVKPWCTTCGSREYLEHLQTLCAPVGGPLVQSLVDRESSELMDLPDWQGALEIALRDLPLPGQIDEVVTAWAANIGRNLRFDDFVLFRIIRRRGDWSVRTQWIDSAVPMAVAASDFSLIETLLLTLRSDAHRYPELMRAATSLAGGSAQMRRVLRNACGIEVLPSGPPPSR